MVRGEESAREREREKERDSAQCDGSRGAARRVMARGLTFIATVSSCSEPECGPDARRSGCCSVLRKSSLMVDSSTSKISESMEGLPFVLLSIAVCASFVIPCVLLLCGGAVVLCVCVSCVISSCCCLRSVFLLCDFCSCRDERRDGGEAALRWPKSSSAILPTRSIFFH